MNNIHETNTIAETHAFGIELARSLSVGDCVALNGDLGSGKTALVRGITEGLGGDLSLVSSPTYVLVQEYPLCDNNNMCLFHIDLYRMASPENELVDLGIDEMLANGIVIIEWAAKAKAGLPCPRLEILIESTGINSRRFLCRSID
jgi:tRNA threonylcarbamoyl adenosine modification protein YjeE